MEAIWKKYKKMGKIKCKTVKVNRKNEGEKTKNQI